MCKYILLHLWFHNISSCYSLNPDHIPVLLQDVVNTHISAKDSRSPKAKGHLCCSIRNSDLQYFLSSYLYFLSEVSYNLIFNLSLKLSIFVQEIKPTW